MPTLGLRGKLSPPDQPAERVPTLRDQFAMAALTGMLAADKFAHKECASDAYEIADAMLEARSVERKAGGQSEGDYE